MWTVTTVGALDLLVRPQINDVIASLPGNTPIWVVDLDGLPASKTDSGPDWVFVATPEPGSGAVSGWFAEGGSPLLGVTRLNQIGPVHPVTVDVGIGANQISFAAP